MVAGIAVRGFVLGGRTGAASGSHQDVCGASCLRFCVAGGGGFGLPELTQSWSWWW